MTENKQKLENTSWQQQAASRATEAPEAKGDRGKEIPISPTLAGYFEEKRASPSAFFKVLRKNGVKQFRAADKDAAVKLMARQDPEGERLWALMSQSDLPEAVDAWIWGAAQSRLKEHLGEAFDPQELDTARIFKGAVSSLSPDLRSDNAEKKSRAETWLRVAICWLMERRSLKAWQVVEELQLVLFPELRTASRAARRAIQKGKSGELRLAVAMAGLGSQMVKAAEEERNRDRHIATDLRHRLDEGRGTIERLSSELEKANKSIADHETMVAALQQTLVNERQHWGHDLTETKAEQKVLLGERLGPLLQDAIDALEIDPPAPGTALRRVRAALTVIEGARNE